MKWDDVMAAQRFAAGREATATVTRRARLVRVVAGNARDASDCRLLLEVLGLDPIADLRVEWGAQLVGTGAQ
jgi:hypothetical protein